MGLYEISNNGKNFYQLFVVRYCYMYMGIFEIFCCWWGEGVNNKYYRY